MLKLVGRRLLISIPMIFIVTFLVFALVDFAPGDPARTLAGDSPTPERVAAIREELRLNDPLPVRYARWVGNAVQGDLGKSYVRNRPVYDLIKEKFAITFSELVVALFFMLVIGIALGVIGALRPRGIPDRIVTVIGSFTIAMPPMWLALILILFFAVNNNILPSQGYVPLADGFFDWFQHLLLPGFVLAAVPGAELALQLKGGLAETMGRDYVLAATAKGLPRNTLIFKHALKNAAIPVVTVLGLRIGQIIGSSVIVDTIFTMNGLGSLAMASVLSGDIPVLLGFVVLTTLVTITMNVLVDISYGYFNPKIRTA
ncbi:MAG: ABC transporter permease [Acidimicrobiia bacterium]